MGTTYLDITITAEDGGVILFETECAAEIEYETDRSDGLTEWRIRNLRFDKTVGEWKDGTFQYRKVDEAWADKALLSVLLRYVNEREIEEQLVEKLQEQGELSYANSGLRADYHAAVL